MSSSFAKKVATETNDENDVNDDDDVEASVVLWMKAFEALQEWSYEVLTAVVVQVVHASLHVSWVRVDPSPMMRLLLQFGVDFFL